uniref:cGMP-dependent protein kinase n=1 Tax=Paramecium tetraurelia TaxID=5888 RepID=Q869K0_PARTE|nr:cGMP-dependent protein kinase [Paramecium tetraurelia]
MGVCISNTQQTTTEIAGDQMIPGQLNKPSLSLSSLAVEPRRGDRKRQTKIEVVEEQIHENVMKQQKEKSPFDFQMILNAFGNHFMFAQLDNNDKAKLIEEMYYVTSKDQEFVFKQGDKATLFFIIERGQCQITINEEKKRVLKPSEFFGELALMCHAPRSASVIAIGDCGFWVLERYKFRKAVEDIQQKAYETNREFLAQVKFFDSMTEEQRDSIANVLITLKFKQGESIVNEGDMANSFYIIFQGTVQVTKQGQFLRYMNQGDSFGEQALFGNCVRGATVKAHDSDVNLLSLSREDITTILGEKIQLIIYTNMQKWAFEKHPKLRDLTKMQIQKIVSNFKIKSYESNDCIFKMNQLVDKLIIILDGQLEFEGQLYNNGQLFGDKYLQMEEQKRKINHDIKTNRKTTLSELPFRQFFECIGGELETVVKKNKDRAGSSSLLEKKQKSNYSLLTLEDFIGLKLLGEGTFGNAYLVKDIPQQNMHVMKCVPKVNVIANNTERHIKNEKQVLELLNHPNLVCFRRSFKDQNYIYLLTEYVKGKELFHVIREIGLLNSYETQFYIAQMINILEKLHSQHIIYRDVKPENFIVMENGYIKLIDMGTAKVLKSRASKTYTLVGTPHYMAPEILKGKGYSFSTDLWSLGICFYELMCGEVPFAGDEEDDPFIIEEAILNGKLEYPQILKDFKAIKLMDQLMNRTPELRLGGSFEALKVHPWFDGFQWEELEAFQLKPPYYPKLQQMIFEEMPFLDLIQRDTSPEMICTQFVDWDQDF